jgi:8-oxo-dGTP pyrophosphatase MutT (NUDIX family)
VWQSDRIDVVNFRVEVAVVVLADPMGRILMQHRTADAPTDPNLWALPGGAIEPGEEPAAAAHRELFEETGLRCPDLTHDRTVVAEFGNALAVRYHLFSGFTQASDDDIVLGEGQAMTFLTLEHIWQKDLSPMAKTLLPARPKPSN